MEDILDQNQITLNVEGLLAKKGVRFANYLIDLTITTAISTGLLIPIMESGGMEGILTNLMGYLVSFTYYFIMEGVTGKTVGKYVTKTRVVTEEGEKPSMLNIAGRSFSRWIPFDAFSYLGSKSIGWHDSIPKCRVIKE
tara:strand:- start:10 stop:426 length:417 start_codon:yes stop_codon:yes gene_type:complete